MATVTETSDDYIARLNRESARLEAETRRLMAEAGRLQAERSKALARQAWLDKLVCKPASFMGFCLVLTIAIMGLGALLFRLLSQTAFSLYAGLSDTFF